MFVPRAPGSTCRHAALLLVWPIQHVPPAVAWMKIALKAGCGADNNEGSEAHMQEIVKDSPIFRVPYRENRLVLFNSNLFHQTDEFHFKPGFRNRRINITLLFGKRGAHLEGKNAKERHK